MTSRLTPERQRFYRHRKALAVHAYLLEHPCIDCGEKDPVVLDFDHVRGEKRSNVKRMLAGTHGLATVMDEIAKCDVRCSNCHRRITAKRGGFFSYLISPAPQVTDAKKPRMTDDEVCGTRTGYRRGCRCDRCMESQRVYQAKWRGSRAGNPEPACEESLP